jgi:hypothetical protein
MNLLIELTGLGNILLFFSGPTYAEMELTRRDQQLRRHRKGIYQKFRIQLESIQDATASSASAAFENRTASDRTGYP